MAAGKKRGKRKKEDGPDLLTIVIVAVAIVLVLILLINYNKDRKEKKTGATNATVTVAPIVPSEGGTPVKEPTKQPTKQPTATPTVPPQATKAPESSITPTPTEVPMLSVEEAKAILRNKIDLDADAYSIELLDDHLMIEGMEYYNFCINDTNGDAMEPLLIVEKKEGTLLCYDFSGVVSQFSKFPLDKTETGSAGVDVITAEEAKHVLSGYSAEALGLAKELSSYEMTVDDWLTVIHGKECYGINLFETMEGKQRYRGVFYVTLDGTSVYSEDGITGDFIER